MRPHPLLPPVLLACTMVLAGCCRAVLCEPLLSPGLDSFGAEHRHQDGAGECEPDRGRAAVFSKFGDRGAALPLLGATGSHHTIDVLAPGFMAQQAPFTLHAASGEGCCLCGAIGYGTVELTPVETMTEM